MTIIAGSFPHQVHIQKKTAGTDEWGTPLPEAWESLTVKPIWANVRHLSGSEAVKADADVSTVKVSIRIRWRTSIDAGMRALHAGAVYDIKAVLPGPSRDYVDLVCVKVT